jgi:hypothetical protein
LLLEKVVLKYVTNIIRHDVWVDKALLQVQDDAIAHELIVFIVRVQLSTHHLHMLHVFNVKFLRVDFLLVLGQLNLPFLLVRSKFEFKVIHFPGLVVLSADYLFKT